MDLKTLKQCIIITDFVLKYHYTMDMREIQIFFCAYKYVCTLR